MTASSTLQIEFYKGLQQYDHNESLERHLVYLTAPVLKGVKSSELVMLRKQTCIMAWMQKKDLVCKGLGLSYFELHVSACSVAVLLYNEDSLNAVMQDKKVTCLLRQMGYTEDCLICNLCRLASRFKENSFPHEIGLFLDYPPEDVESFILYEGRNYICSHYWKVYHNQTKALERFRNIDDAKKQAIQILSCNISTQAAVRQLTAS